MKIPKRLNDIEDSVSKQIREAMERGDFDHLRGTGKPLDLGEDAHVPAEWKLAFKMLKDAQVAPQWIEQDKEIRADARALDLFLERQVAWQRQQRANLKSLAIEKIPDAHTQLQAARLHAIAEYRRRATALNQTIDAFNLQVPTSRLQHARVAIEDALENFSRACDQA
ncbi:MAG: DUF1992 domain-containing protein [Chloroflexi bacterium]|nr:DUF1992 domain-containing protein [Chloroflexota bacterium]